MTIAEQLRRVLIVAPHLPIQAFASISMIVGMYVATSQGIQQLSTDWIETKATEKKIGTIEFRTVDEKSQYFFVITHFFEANGITYDAVEEKTYDSQKNAELGLKVKSRDFGPTKIFYERTNPVNYQFENRVNGYAVLSINFIFIGMLAYFRWLFLKYYELEIETESNIH